MHRLIVPGVLAVLTACGPSSPTSTGSQDAGPTDRGLSNDAGPMDAGGPPVTTAVPPGETHTGALAVVLTSTPAATISYTTDGSDPRTSATAQSGASPVTVTLDAPAQVTLTFSAKDAAGTESPVTEQYSLIQDLQAASISGQLIVPDSMKSGSGVIALFNQNPTTMGATPIDYAMVDPGAPAGAQYVFQGLAAGTYWVIGEWWPGSVSGNASAMGRAGENPISLNPTTPGMERADFVNVYIGLCDPADTGVDGVVEVGSSLLSDGVAVVAYSNPLDLSSLGMPVTYTVSIGDGAERPFAICGITAGDLYLVAEAFPSGAQSPQAYAAYPMNPVATSPVPYVTLDLGTSSSTEGSLAGTVILNGPLAGGTVSVAISPTPWTQGQLDLSTTATMSDATDYAYDILGVTAGTYYPLVQVTSSDGYTANFVGSGMITISAATAAMQNLDASVGRISGTVTIGNVPAGSGDALLVAVPVGGSAPAATSKISLTATNVSGQESGAYVLFGLPNGTYQVTAIVDENNDGSFQDDLAAGNYGTATMNPAISAGDSQPLDFTFSL